MPLTQKRFAQLLVEAMGALGVKGKDLAKALSPRHPTTISRYRNPTYESGPPEPAVRRLLEHEMGLPAGYLDGTVQVDLMALRDTLRAPRSGGGQGAHNGHALQATLQNIRAGLDALARQVEIAEMLAGGTERRATDSGHGLDPAAVVELAESARRPSGPAAKPGHRRHA